MMENKKEALIITSEECSELIQALCKMDRIVEGDRTCNKTKQQVIDNIKEEIADVEICIEKVKQAFNITNREVRKIKQIKTKRTKERREQKI